MANLASTYANICGVKLPQSPPKFPTLYFPVPKRYITIHNGSGHPNKNYDFYDEVLNLIRPKLIDNGIEIIQLGTRQERLLNGVIDFRDVTTIRQSTFVVENAMAHVGNDSFLSHVAGAKNTPLILVNSVNPVEAIKPHYIGEHIIIDSDRDGDKPYYGNTESPKTINIIKPESIAESILKTLGLGGDGITSIQTFYIGSEYRTEQLDLIPDFPVQPNVFSNKKIVIRADLHLNFNAVGHALTLYKCAIITNKPIPFSILNRFKDNIPIIYYVVEKNYDKQFIAALHLSGLKYLLVSTLEDKDLSDAKLDLFDYSHIYRKVKFDKSKIDKDCYFKTNRTFISDKKLYASAYHWLNKIPFSGEATLVGDAIDHERFLESAESYYFFKNNP